MFNILNQNSMKSNEFLPKGNFLKRISIDGNILLKDEYRNWNIKSLEIQNNLLFPKWLIRNIKNMFYLKIYNSNLNEHHEIFTSTNDLSILQYLNISKNPIFSIEFLKKLKLKI